MLILGRVGELLSILLILEKISQSFEGKRATIDLVSFGRTKVNSLKVG